MQKENQIYQRSDKTFKCVQKLYSLDGLQQIQQIHYNLDNDKEDLLNNNQEDKSHFPGEQNHTVTAKDIVGNSINTSTKSSDREMFPSESLSLLKKRLFIKREFFASTFTSDNRYSYLRSEYDNLFYSFHDQLDSALSYYFIVSGNTKGKIKRFLSDSLMASLSEKLFYKNANQWMKKLLEIFWGIPENLQIELKFDIESNISKIAR